MSFVNVAVTKALCILCVLYSTTLSELHHNHLILANNIIVTVTHHYFFDYFFVIFLYAWFTSFYITISLHQQFMKCPMQYRLGNDAKGYFNEGVTHVMFCTYIY